MLSCSRKTQLEPGNEYNSSPQVSKIGDPMELLVGVKKINSQFEDALTGTTSTVPSTRHGTVGKVDIRNIGASSIL